MSDEAQKAQDTQEPQTEFRFGDDAPEPLRGLTPQEVAGKYEAMQQYVQELAAMAATAVARQQQQQPQYAAYAQPQTDVNPDLWLTDPAKAEAALLSKINAQMQAYANAVAAPILQSNAATARHLSASDPQLASIWKKYGHEIDALMNSPQIPAVYKTSKQVWDQAAQLIASRHLDEIAKEKAAKMAAAMGAVPDAAQAGPTILSKGELSAIERIKKTPYGEKLVREIGERGIVKNCEKAGWSLDQFANMVEKVSVREVPGKPGEWYNRNLTGGNNG